MIQKQFVDDLWFIVRRLRDMKKPAEDYGVQDEVQSAQARLAGALGTLESIAVLVECARLVETQKGQDMPVRVLKRNKGSDGWTIDYAQLLEIKRRVDVNDDSQAMEDVEVVLLAAVKAGFALLEPKEP